MYLKATGKGLHTKPSPTLGSLPAGLNQRGTTLSDLTKKRRKPCSDDCQSKLCPAPEICRKSHVVYLATCDRCGKRYVGMTVRQLHARALEHLRAANQRQDHTAFGDHYKTGHKDKDIPKLSFKIISQNHDDLRLHIEEALAIKTLKPELNERQEEMGTGFLPWTLSQLLPPSPNASFTPLTVHSLLLSHLLTPILLTPLHNTHTTSIPQHFYLTHSHSSLTLKFHSCLFNKSWKKKKVVWIFLASENVCQKRYHYLFVTRLCLKQNHIIMAWNRDEGAL